MTLQIGDAIGDGIRRSLTKSGGVLMALMFAYMLVFMGAMNTVMLEFLPKEAQGSEQFGLALPVPPAVAGAITLLGMLFGIVFYIVAVRALTRDQAKLSSLPSELFTRRIGRATISAIGANIITQIAITIGFILLFIPGIFLAVSLIFVVFAIGVEDRRAIDSLSRSWQLVSGNRWSLFALGLIVVVTVGIVGGVSSIFTIVDPVIGQIVNLAVISIVSIVSYGILADAYVQLRDDEEIGGSGGTETPDTTGTAI
ncbi:hypothetical protein HWV07_17655 [Natronomonas salina]|uniref:hypothetical protein n=1 Tax=Natronomonas salina TaxID=1710540 RepID=UPI0015B60284|nr:hypothetical protein [Natronomonas salina]QLD90770.1 hypothetical protein HWV07_17655 [Natronomonas salina]